MEALSSYQSDSDGEGDASVQSAKEPPVECTDHLTGDVCLDSLKSKYQLQIAPVVHETNLKENDPRKLVESTTKELTYSATYDDMFAPELGPDNPFKTRQQNAKKNMLSGFVEKAHFSDFQFDNQQKTFTSYGYALDPSAENEFGKAYIGDLSKRDENKELTVFEGIKSRPGDKRKKTDFGNPADLDGYQGPWAPFVDESKSSKPTEEQQQILEVYEEKREKKGKKEEDKIEETSKTHIEDTHDYQGRPFLHVPLDLTQLKALEPPEKCFLPKKLIHTWTGHSKGVAAIRVFPNSGHLLLSASMDCKIKIWEVYEKRRMIQTYIGHTKAVRDICFNNDGTKFLSCGYDRWIKEWDTETGECTGRWTNKRIPYCVKYNPDEDKQHLFITGMSDNKMVTWDSRENEIVQEYDRHLGSVNTITFVDQNRRIISTSDDKSLRIWEWDIPVDSKIISDPGLHSCPATTLSPNGKWLACQSLDNQITIYSVLGRFRQNRKKIFKGHMNSGYACQVNFSPDMSYIISGDADGKLNIWDWKTSKLYCKFKAHDEVCIGCVWLPHETSKIVTCSWDGLIKLWD